MQDDGKASTSRSLRYTYRLLTAAPIFLYSFYRGMGLEGSRSGEERKEGVVIETGEGGGRDGGRERIRREKG